MAHIYNSPQISPGYDHFDLWVMEVFQLFAAKWWVWMLQGLIFSVIALAFVSIIALATDIPTLLSLFSGNTETPPVIKVDVYSFYVSIR
ncbi:MAG: hypothetical protein WCJ56_13110 [bacterium]